MFTNKTKAPSLYRRTLLFVVIPDLILVDLKMPGMRKRIRWKH